MSLFLFLFYGFRENGLTGFLLLIPPPNNVDFHIYFSRELTFLWQNKIISLSKWGSQKIINIHHNIYHSYFSEFQFCYNVSYVFLILYYFYFYLILVMGKDIGIIYKHGQSHKRHERSEERRASYVR